MLRKLGIGLTALTMMSPGIAMALGVGQYTLNSYLNQPLNMDVQLHEVGDLSADEILVNLASQDEFDAAGVDRNYFLDKLKFKVQLTGGDNAVLHITSSQPVREPYLNFLVEFLWPTGRLMREYTVLLDPPSYADAGQASAPAVTRAPQPAAPTATPASPAPATAPATAPQSSTEESSAPAAGDQTAAPAGYVSDTSGPHDTYTVQPSDTMWRIALNNRPSDSVSVQQMLVAIQQMNPDAFIDSNVNLVRKGTVLRIPNEQEVRNISTRSALSQVAEQNRQWRKMLDARGIQMPQHAQIDGSSQTARSDDSGNAPKAGEVKLVSPDSSSGVGDGSGAGSAKQGSGDSAALQNELAIRDENIDRLDRENTELKSRLDDLNDQVSTSGQLLKLRNDQISKLQDELRKLRESQGIKAPKDDSLMAAPATADQGAGQSQPSDTDAQPADQVAADNGSTASDQTAPQEPAATKANGKETGAAGAETDANVDKPQDQADATTPKADQQTVKPVTPATKPKPVKPAPAPVVQSGGIVQLLMDNLLYIGLGLIAILLLIVVLLRRKKQYNEDEVAAHFAAMGDEDADGEDDDGDFALDLDEDDGAAVADSAEPAAGDEQEAARDPLEDVDIYVAYGQYPQATDFLRNEINKSPQRDDLKVRLLELLHEMGDESAFEQQVSQYAGTSSAIDAAISRLGGTVPVKEKSSDELSLDDLEMDLASDLGGVAGSDNDAAPELGESEALTGEEDSLADFDFELGETTEANDNEQPSDEHASLDFSADFSTDEDKHDSSELSAADAEGMNADSLLDLDDVSSASMDDNADFGELSLDDLDEDFDSSTVESKDEDFDLSLDDLDLSEGDQEKASSEPLAADELDDLSLELDNDQESAAEAPVAAEAEPEASLEFDDFELELDSDAESQQDAELPESDASFELDDLELDVKGDAEEPAAEPESLELEESSEQAADSFDLNDLDLDQPSAEPAQEPASIAPTPAPAAEPKVDAGAAQAEEESDVLTDEDDDFDFLGEADENATKLDLAKAYIDMGDAEGAKDILNEVLSEGNDQQQTEARELLAQVG
ncbi:MAG: FimV/HubP family polar landmark protein [Alcanivorax sp.]|nr:FimV/HubP family polar landmark protein [Alcanivorax sp.]